MRRDVGGAVARLRADLRLLLTERYRTALEQRSRVVVIVVAAAGIVDRLTAFLRFTRRIHGPRTALSDSVVARLRQLRSPQSLTCAHAAIGGTDELSLTLVGAIGAEDLGVRLVRDGILRDLPAVVSPTGDGVRIAAHLPLEVFSGAPWRIEVHAAGNAGGGAVTVVTPARAALVRRYEKGFAQRSWPPRIVLDAARELSLEGRAPTVGSVEHTVAVGMTSAVVSWSEPAGGAPDLLLTRSGGNSTMEVRGREDADGTRRAALDLPALAAGGDASWDVSVPAAGTWLPLQLALGEFPVLADLPDERAVPVRCPDGTAVSVRVGYSASNQLSVRVGTLR